jgi:hypothetical protein
MPLRHNDSRKDPLTASDRSAKGLQTVKTLVRRVELRQAVFDRFHLSITPSGTSGLVRSARIVAAMLPKVIKGTGKLSLEPAFYVSDRARRLRAALPFIV